MRSRLGVCLIVPMLVLLGSAGSTFGEVFAEVGGDGRSASTHIAIARGAHPGRVWQPIGAAVASSYVLNPDGDRHGDGRPDFAINPLTHLSRAVWAQRNSSGYDIVTSQFDGNSWSFPMVIHTANDADDVDPRITYRSDGVAIVTWWVRAASPVVRLAFSSPDGRWTDAGIVSPTGTRANRPELRQEGALTIVAYRTPANLEIVTLSIVVPTFADGPTPFPHSEGPQPED